MISNHGWALTNRMPMFTIALYTSLTVLLSGLLFQWVRFAKKSNALKQDPDRPRKLQQLFSLNIFGGIANTLFQTRLFRAGKIRWLIHLVGIIGFCYLVFFHAMDDIISYDLFDNYESTLDPYQWLRNLAGVFVLAGCLGFLFKRALNTRINQDKPVKRKGIYSIVLIILVIATGFLLEASKIISEPVFMEMVEEYSDVDEDSDLEDLKIYWNRHYNGAFTPDVTVTPERLENGRDLNETYCLDCHAPMKSAFLSSRIADHISKLADWTNRNRHDITLYRIHYLLSFLMLISFPFSRFSHIFFIPLASLRRQVTEAQFTKNNVSIPMATLYACTNCGYCSQVCSVYPNFQITGNRSILPHAKIDFAKTILHSPHMDAGLLRELRSGNDDCTMCRNCTDICPSGIDLQGLWKVLDQRLVGMGYPDNYTLIKTKDHGDIGKTETAYERETSNGIASYLSFDPDAFEACIQCTICTNVCPVVEHDSKDNDLTPQQVLNFLRLGKKELVTETRMVWNCLTCYSCQEVCPQGIKVTDILLELRNIGNTKADKMNLNGGNI
jgi:heterodisulfide reductase subunit C/nitrate reductase gamma subunit